MNRDHKGPGPDGKSAKVRKESLAPWKSHENGIEIPYNYVNVVVNERKESTR